MQLDTNKWDEFTFVASSSPELTRNEVLRPARADGLWFAELPASAFGSKEVLLGSTASALRFPANWGRNWDALRDCLGDLSWLKPEGVVILLHLCGPGTEEALLSEFAEVIAGAALEWRGRGEPFYVLIETPEGPSGEPVRRIFRDAAESSSVSCSNEQL